MTGSLPSTVTPTVAKASLTAVTQSYCVYIGMNEYHTIAVTITKRVLTYASRYASTPKRVPVLENGIIEVYKLYLVNNHKGGSNNPRIIHKGDSVKYLSQCRVCS